MTKLLRGEVVTHHGRYVHVDDAYLLAPWPVQPTIPLLIGGNGARVLRLGGRSADIVSLTGMGRTLEDGHRHEVDWSDAAIDGCVAHVSGAAPEQSRPVLDALVQHVGITEHRVDAAVRVAEFVPGANAAHIIGSPYTLLGTLDQLADEVVQHYERWGFTSYVVRADARSTRPRRSSTACAAPEPGRVQWRSVVTRYRSFISDSARWEGFAFRPDDIVISTPAKCGTTWMQMISALLVFQTTTSDKPLDLDLAVARHADPRARLTSSPTSKRRRIAGSSRRTRRSTACRYDERVTYIAVGRDPRDVALSWDNHMANMDFDAMIGARATAVGLDDLAELFPDGLPERADSRDRALLAVGRRSPSRRPTTSSRSPPCCITSRRSGRARSAERGALPLRRAEGRPRRPDAPARRAARHRRSRGTLARTRRRRDVRARCARGADRDRARHDPRDLAGQPAVLPPRRQRPVARRCSTTTGCVGTAARFAELAEPDLAAWVHREPQPAP